MNLFDELENLAVSATYEDPEENVASYDSTKGTIKMWQERFGYTYDQAAELVKLTQTVKDPSTTRQQAILSPAQARTIHALKLDGPISTPQKVQIAANLPNIPVVYRGSGEEGDAVFCEVDGRTKMAIENWFSKQKQISFRPLFVPDGRAYKELSSYSIYPTLGKDATLPQYRPQDPHLLDTPASFGRTQDQFPAWYFFYGTLAGVPKLRSVLSLPGGEVPILHEESVKGGTMATWGKGKYNALVDGQLTDCVKGLAYRVMSEEHEDSLRKYETSAYEVVRCLIEMSGVR